MSQIDFDLNVPGGGIKRYSIVPLKRKEAVRVFHRSLQGVLGALGTGGSIDFASVAKQLDFDLVWDLSSSLLRHVMIDEVEVDLEEYFAANPLEMYLATVEAIQRNWPGVFSGLLGGLGETGPAPQEKPETRKILCPTIPSLI